MQEEESLGYRCTLVGHQYLHAMRKLLRALDMDRWYFALVHLADAKGPVTQQQLADELHLDKATMVRALDHLSKHGYVVRADCPHDRRKHHLQLQPKARPVVKKIRAAYAELNNVAFGDTAPAERQLLMDHLEQMLRRLQEQGNRLPAQPTKTRK